MPLTGLNPRTILGQVWWDKERISAQRKTQYRCLACGVHKIRARYFKWLEGHETYHIDYIKGRATYLETVPLCHSCHNFIHMGRLTALYNKGKISLDKLETILSHGKNIIKDLPDSLKKHEIPVCAKWSDWRLVIAGKEYEPLLKNYEEWLHRYS